MSQRLPQNRGFCGKKSGNGEIRVAAQMRRPAKSKVRRDDETGVPESHYHRNGSERQTPIEQTKKQRHKIKTIYKLKYTIQSGKKRRFTPVRIC